MNLALVHGQGPGSAGRFLVDIRKEQAMKILENRQWNRSMLTAVAAALALGLTACGEKPSNDQFGQNLERGNTVTPLPDRSADAAPRPDSGMSGRTTDAGKTMDDATLTNRVKSAITADSSLKSLTINVDTMAGVVTLKGTADSQANRQKAEQIASAVDGVRTVKNELVVISG